MKTNAIAFASAKHSAQKRKFTGEPYIVHPLAVAELVASTGAPDHVVAAAVLHDVLEDTATTYAELVAAFGEPVAALVSEVTHVYPAGTGGNRAARKAKEQARLATVSAEAQTIKVADMIDNCSNVAERSPAFAKVFLPEQAALLAVLTRANPALRRQAAQLFGTKGQAGPAGAMAQ